MRHRARSGGAPLNVIGGGIDRFIAPQLPAVIQATVVGRVLLDAGDLNREHNLQVEVRQEEGDAVVAAIEGAFSTTDPYPDSWEPGASMALKLDGIPLPAYGFYNLAIRINGEPMKILPRRVTKPSARRAKRKEPAPLNATIRPRKGRRK